MTSLKLSVTDSTLTEEFTEDGQVVLARDENGIVKSGNMTCQIPRDRSALGLLAMNKAFNGDVFADDYWVYNNGQKVRKWFVSTETIKRLWPPNLDDTNRLEALYERLSERMHVLWNKTIVPTMEKILAAGGHAHAKPTHEYTGDKNMWWVYRVSRREERLGFSFDWIDSPPKKKINHKLGEALYKADRYHTSLGYRLSIARDALDSSIQQKIRAKIKSSKIENPKDHYFHVEVNGRSYWYTMQRTYWGGYELKCLVWPESKTEHILIGDEK